MASDAEHSHHTEKEGDGEGSQRLLHSKKRKYTTQRRSEPAENKGKTDESQQAGLHTQRTFKRRKGKEIKVDDDQRSDESFNEKEEEISVTIYQPTGMVRRKRVRNKTIMSTAAPLISIIGRLTPAQRKDIEEIGFAGLLHVKFDRLPKKMMATLVDSFDPISKTLHINDKIQFHITLDDVYDVLCLPKVGEKVVELGKRDREGAALKKQWRSRFGIKNQTDMIPLGILEDCIANDLRNGGPDFKRMFVLVVMSSFLAPMAKREVDLKLLRAVEDVDKIRNHDWNSYVFDKLIEGIESHKTDGQKKVGGCVPILLIQYFQRVTWFGTIAPPILPLVGNWETKLLLRRGTNEVKVGVGLGSLEDDVYPISRKQADRISLNIEAPDHLLAIEQKNHDVRSTHPETGPSIQDDQDDGKHQADVFMTTETATKAVEEAVHEEVEHTPSTTAPDKRYAKVELSDGIYTDEEIDKIVRDNIHQKTQLLLQRDMQLVNIIMRRHAQRLKQVQDDMMVDRASQHPQPSQRPDDAIYSSDHLHKIVDEVADMCALIKELTTKTNNLTGRKDGSFPNFNMEETEEDNITNTVDSEVRVVEGVIGEVEGDAKIEDKINTDTLIDEEQRKIQRSTTEEEPVMRSGSEPVTDEMLPTKPNDAEEYDGGFGDFGEIVEIAKEAEDRTDQYAEINMEENQQQATPDEKHTEEKQCLEEAHEAVLMSPMYSEERVQRRKMSTTTYNKYGIVCSINLGESYKEIPAMSEFMKMHSDDSLDFLPERCKYAVDYCMLDNKEIMKKFQEREPELFQNEESELLSRCTGNGFLMREQMWSLRGTEYIEAGVLDAWAAMMNEMEHRERSKPSRLFFGSLYVGALVQIIKLEEDTEKSRNEKQEEEKMRTAFILDVWRHWLTEQFGKNKISINEADLIFFPLMWAEHYALIVVNVKTRTLDYLDERRYTQKSVHGDWDSLSNKFRATAEYMQVRLLGILLSEHKHPLAPEVQFFPIRCIQFPWTKEEGSSNDCGIYNMAHMLNYDGDEDKSFAHDLSNQQYRFTCRADVAAAVLLTDINMERDELVIKLEKYKKLAAEFKQEAERGKRSRILTKQTVSRRKRTKAGPSI